MENTTISVVMPVHNGEKYLRQAIESILNQSFKNFEFIIVNDGSADKTDEIAQSYDDSRIIYIKNENNEGLSASLNIGIKRALGEYIARMDSDDISLPDRFSKQLLFLEENTDIDIVGSSIQLITAEGQYLKKHYRNASHIGIKWSSLFSTPMYHPTIMARGEIFKSNLYNEDSTSSEDYELWSRLLFNSDTRFANIREVLLLHRVHPNSFTQSLKSDKIAASALNTISNLENYIIINEEQRKILNNIRQVKYLSERELWTIWKIYRRAAISFNDIEKLKSADKMLIYSKLFSLAFFLITYIFRPKKS